MLVRDSTLRSSADDLFMVKLIDFYDFVAFVDSLIIHEQYFFDQKLL
jgi:hypothetical protein